MFALFSYLALSKDSFTAVNPPDGASTCFDLRYVSGSNQKQITRSSGFFVAYKIYKDKTPENANLMAARDQPAVYQDVTIKYETGVNSNTGYLTPSFIIENNGHYDMKVDLGVFAKSIFDEENKSPIKMRADRRGFFVDHKSGKFTYSLLVKGTDFQDADTIYLGSSQDNAAALSYPYFTDSGSSSTEESSFAFSWKNILVKPGDRKTLGFVVVPGAEIHLAPSVKQLTALQESYQQNQDINLEFEVIDFDIGKTVTVNFNDNGTSATETFTTSENAISKKFTRTFNLKDKLIINYEVSASDGKSYSSQVLRNRITADGARPPNLILEVTPNAEYNVTDIIKVKGYLEDETGGAVIYKFDEDGKEFRDPKLRVNASRIVVYSGKFQIPSHLEPNINHTLYILVEDDLGIRSTPLNFSFMLRVPPAPVINSAFLSRIQAVNNQKIIVYGVATDPNIGDELKIYAQVGDKEPIIIGKHEVEETTVPFAFFLPLKDIDFGTYPVKVFAVDKTDLVSIVNVSKKIQIVDPENPVKPPKVLGNITDKSDKMDGENGCFELAYKPPNGREVYTSFNSYGYYVGYRLYEDNKPQDTHLVRNKEQQTSTTNNVTVKYRYQYDPITGYFMALFDISNKNYFAQKIDLSVYVDPAINWGDDDDKVRMRDDKRGFVISDESNQDQPVKLTFFTKDFGSLPNADAVYLGSIYKGDDYEEIDPTRIQFYEPANEEPLTGDIVCSISWLARVVEPDETLTLGFYVAPDDDVKTPTRLVDVTALKEYYSKNERVTLKFQVEDGDIGERIQVNLNLNGQQETRNFTVRTDQKSFQFEVPVTVGPASTYHYTAQAVDNDERFVSNLIDKYLYVSKPPSLRLETMLRPIYYVGTDVNVLIDAIVKDEEGGLVKMRFDNGRIITVGKFEAYDEDEDYEDLGGVEVYKRIDIPDEYLKKNADHTISIWAEDEFGIRSSSSFQHEFSYVIPVPPKLLKAGISHKAATRGQKLLMYCVIDDDWAGKEVYIQIRYDQKGDFFDINHFNLQDTLAPYAFYYFVPASLEPGVHTIEFRARDSDRLPSEQTIVRTIVITQ